MCVCVCVRERKREGGGERESKRECVIEDHVTHRGSRYPSAQCLTCMHCHLDVCVCV